MFTGFNIKKELFDLQNRHNNDLELVKKIPFFSNYTIDVFLFITDIISLVVTSIVLYIICKHAKLKFLVTGIALQQLREVDAVTKQEHVSVMHDIECTCKIQWYTIYMLHLLTLGIVIFYYSKCWETKAV